MNSQYEQIDSAIPVTQFTTAAKQVTGAILQAVGSRFASSSSITMDCPQTLKMPLHFLFYDFVEYIFQPTKPA